MQRRSAGEGRTLSPGLLLLAPALLVLAVVYIMPLGQIALLSVHAPALSVAEYTKLAADPVAPIILLRTVRIALEVTALCLLIGYPIAYLILRSPSWLRPVLTLLIILPLWTSILVRSYAWMAILGREGVVNSALQAVGLTDGPVPLLYNRFSVYVGMIHIMLPLMVLPLYNTLNQIEPRLVRAAQSLGAGRAGAFFLVLFPLSFPGIAAGCALVFILSLGFFVTPALLGGLKDVTFVMMIERYVNALRNWEAASAMSVVLLCITLLLMVVSYRRAPDARTARNQPTQSGPPRWLFHAAMLAVDLRSLFVRLLGRTNVASGRPLLRPSEGVESRTVVSDDRDRPGWFVSILGWAGIAFLTLPLVIIFLLAFSDAPFLKFPPTGFSLRWFESFVYRPGWVSATIISIEVATMTMLVATMIGTMAAVAIVRWEFPAKGLIVGLLLSPIVVPTVVLAIALYFQFARLGFVGTIWGLVLGHVILAVPYVIVVVSGGLRSVDQSLERAAQTLGAPPVKAFLRVTLPVIRPTVLTGAFFAFLASFDELVVALFISGTGAKTLPKRMWEGVREEIDPTTAAVAAMLILLSLLLLLVSEVARSRAKRLRAPAAAA